MKYPERRFVSLRPGARLGARELADHEAIDVFVRKEDALKALEDACTDEPQWEGTLFVAPIELDERDQNTN
jgi:hypothetical protein